MSTNNTILLLGSNLGDRYYQLNIARSLINKEVGEIIKKGEIIETEPVEFTSPDLFLNQLIEITTNLSPIGLLKSIKKIEKEMGRVYTTPLANEKYVSRIIDIDILKMGEIKYQSDCLIIPHSQIYTREFVREMIISFK